MSGQMSLVVFLLLLTLISYSNGSFEELEIRMNSKFHSMEFILKFHFGRIRQLEEVVISQCAQMNKVKSELAITKKENKDRKQQISSLKKIVLKSAFKHSIGKAVDEMHNKRVHLVKDKRRIKGIQPDPSQVHTTAFYAYISQHLTMMEPNRILVFDTVITNLNGGYSPNTGIFTVAVDGVYVFTFSIRDHSTSFCSYEIIKNAEVVVRQLAFWKVPLCNNTWLGQSSFRQCMVTSFTLEHTQLFNTKVLY
ncbi:Hypothetical predicted protein [Mytilus galloprovincialis]|uniref:C1q domain-containing protein n=1 Tax=Mytilus galloprovincialis TaxID=29158 RepID=A0A8B6BMF3_MYTGA|nr:Hypothetical predicted protein [Mytilus galloprovincialis]